MKKGPTVKPITEAERAAFQQFSATNQTVAEQLPARLPSGLLIEEFSPECAVCQKPIPQDQSWLKRNKLEFDTTTVEIWEAKGHCIDCRAQTSCYIRFRSDGSYDTLIGTSWRQGIIRPQKHGARVLRRIRALFRGIL